MSERCPIPALTETRRETWDDGTEVVFLRVPFPVRRKPQVPAKAIKGAVVAEVQVSTLVASQSEVTWKGLRQYKAKTPRNPASDLPLVIYEDGLNYIQDGHHRLVAAALRGDCSVRVRQVQS